MIALSMASKTIAKPCGQSIDETRLSLRRRRYRRAIWVVRVAWVWDYLRGKLWKTVKSITKLSG